MTQWYAVHTQPNSEERARLNLERQGFVVYLPKYRKRQRHSRRVERVLRPLFPRYLFVQFDPQRAQWRAINGTYGVVHLIAHGSLPVPVPDVVIDAIRAREDDDGAVAQLPIGALAPGQRLEILDGPLAWHSGQFLRLNDNDRIVLLLDLLGRQVAVTVSPDAVAAA